MTTAHSRHQDVADAETAVPLLDPSRRAWLREAVFRATATIPVPGWASVSP